MVFPSGIADSSLPRYNNAMPSLIETNPYLRDPKRRAQMIAQDVYDSSVFEGATGLPKPQSVKLRTSSPPRRKMRSAKKRANGK